MHPLPPRSAIPIVTGAPLPAGADAVVPTESCRLARDSAGGLRGWIDVLGDVDTGQFVALTGSEFSAGSLALAPGAVLGPPELAVLAALGHVQARVVPRPRVALVATGSELSRQAGVPPAGQLYASNVALMHGMVVACGATVASVRVAADDPSELAEAFKDALRADLILTTGGTGRGSRDIIGKILLDQEAGSLWNARVRGSKPAAFRLLREVSTGRLVPHLALPGRPIAAMVGFILFAYPLLRRLAGLPPEEVRYRTARLAAGIDGRAGHHRYVPVRLERCSSGWEALPGGESSLYGLAATAGTDGFAVVGRRTGELAKGHRVRVILPPWR